MAGSTYLLAQLTPLSLIVFDYEKKKKKLKIGLYVNSEEIFVNLIRI